MTATETQGSEGGNGMPSMHRIVHQLEEIHKRDALVEERHKAEVAQSREALAVATSTAQDEARREQSLTKETLQEGGTVAKS